MTDQVEVRTTTGWMVSRGPVAEVVRELLDRLTAEELQALKAEHIPAVQTRKRAGADQERLSRAAARGLRLYDPAPVESEFCGTDADAVREHLRGAD